jgi:hypothetical protein
VRGLEGLGLDNVKRGRDGELLARIELGELEVDLVLDIEVWNVEVRRASVVERDMARVGGLAMLGWLDATCPTEAGEVRLRVVGMRLGTWLFAAAATL